MPVMAAQQITFHPFRVWIWVRVWWHGMAWLWVSASLGGSENMLHLTLTLSLSPTLYISLGTCASTVYSS